jgi:hypothetical protein
MSVSEQLALVACASARCGELQFAGLPAEDRQQHDESCATKSLLVYRHDMLARWKHNGILRPVARWLPVQGAVHFKR